MGDQERGAGERAGCRGKERGAGGLPVCSIIRASLTACRFRFCPLNRHGGRWPRPPLVSRSTFGSLCAARNSPPGWRFPPVSQNLCRSTTSQALRAAKGRKKRGSFHPHRFPHPGPQGHHPPCGPFFCPASAGFRPPRAEISGRTHGSRKAVNAVGGLEGPKALQSEIVSPGFAGRAGSLRLWAQTLRKPLAEKIAEGELFRHATKGANPHDHH